MVCPRPCMNARAGGRALDSSATRSQTMSSPVLGVVNLGVSSNPSKMLEFAHECGDLEVISACALEGMDESELDVLAEARSSYPLLVPLPKNPGAEVSLESIAARVPDCINDLVAR